MSLAYVKSLGSLLKQPQFVDIQSPLYRPKYFSEMIRGMTRRHRPLLTGKIPAAVAQVKFSEIDRSDWHTFVKQEPEHNQAPLTYYNSAGAFCLFKILGALRINFSTILHLKATVRLTAPLEAVTPDSVYTLKMQLDEVIPRKHQCILVMKTELIDSSKRVVRVHRDYWFVKKCPLRFLKNVAADQNGLAESFRGLSQKTSSWESWNAGDRIQREHRLGQRAGLHYGRISGDHNIIHTTSWGARLCGQKKPFLQGFGMMNLALHQAAQVQNKTLNELSITFARPALVGQVLQFHFDRDSFEICGEKNQLIAFGQYS